ncbi:MAG: hypothetical protein M3277_07600 [Actinomycetota bacterium]|nr:hypothetical protein [Actinomycetota bacterium]
MPPLSQLARFVAVWVLSFLVITSLGRLAFEMSWLESGIYAVVLSTVVFIGLLRMGALETRTSDKHPEGYDIRFLLAEAGLRGMGLALVVLVALFVISRNSYVDIVAGVAIVVVSAVFLVKVRRRSR